MQTTLGLDEPIAAALSPETRSALTADPGSPAAWQAAIEFLLAAAAFAQAATLLAVADTRVALPPRFTGRCGQRLIKAGHSAAAVAVLRRTLAAAPDEAPAWRQLAIALRELGDQETALDTLRTATNRLPASVLLHADLCRMLSRLGRLDEAQAAAARATALAASPQARERYASEFARCYRDLGTSCLEGGRIEAALRAFETAARFDPALPSAAVQAAEGLAKAGRQGEAADLLRDAAARDLRDGAAWTALAALALRAGRHEEAAAAAARAIAIAPDVAEAHYLGGMAAIRLGAFEAAEQALVRADALNPDHPQCRYARAQLARLTGRHEDALELLAHLLARRPKSLPARQLLARVHFEMGRRRAALEELDILLGLGPDLAPARELAEAARDELPEEPSTALCLLGPPAANEGAALAALAPAFGEVLSAGAGEDWRACLLRATADWLLVVDAALPGPALVRALTGGAGQGIGCVAAGGTALWRRQPLQSRLAAWPADAGTWPAFAAALRRRLALRRVPERQQAQPAVLPPAPPPLAGSAWIVAPESAAGESASSRRTLATLYRRLGLTPVQVSLRPGDAGPAGRDEGHLVLPAEAEGLRRAALELGPAVVHCLPGAPALVGRALEGLDLLSLGEAPAAEATTGEGLRRRLRAAARPVTVAVGAGIGNMVQCTPLIRRLAEHLDQPVTVVVKPDQPGAEHLFAGAPWVGEVISSARLGSSAKTGIVLATHCYGGLIPPFNADHVVLARRFLDFDDTRETHEAEFNLQCGERLLGLPRMPGDSARYFVGGYRHRPAPRRIGLHAGSKGGIWAAKRWPYFEQLARLFAALGYEVVSTGGPGEQVPGTLDRTGTDLPTTIETISRCAYFVANDSGLMHIADGLGVPLTALFGPSSVIKNRPLAATSQVIALDKGCAPCQFDLKQLGACRCIGELAFEEVAERTTAHLRSLL